MGFASLPIGSVSAVRVLGVLGLVDGGEMDWKVLVLRTSDPLAARVFDIDDLERELPGAVSALREWLRVYKVAEGKAVNRFSLNERAMPRDFALRVIAHAHTDWAKTHGAKAKAHARAKL
jgi:inorganic pyrophosphatase